MKHDSPAIDGNLCKMLAIGKELACFVLHVEQGNQDIAWLMCPCDEVEDAGRHTGLSVLTGTNELEVLPIEVDPDRRIAFLGQRAPYADAETVGLSVTDNVVWHESRDSRICWASRCCLKQSVNVVCWLRICLVWFFGDCLSCFPLLFFLAQPPGKLALPGRIGFAWSGHLLHDSSLQLLTPVARCKCNESSEPQAWATSTKQFKDASRYAATKCRILRFL